MSSTQNKNLNFEITQTAFQLKSTNELRRAQALFSLLSYPWLTRMAKPVTEFLLNIRFPITPILRHTVFKQFCGGETLEQCTIKLNELYQVGQVYSILDYSVEHKESEAQFDDTLKTLLQICHYSEAHKATPFIVFKSTGFGRFGLFLKVSQEAQLSELEAAEWFRVKQRFETLFTEVSKSTHIKVMVDAEETWIQNAIDQLIEGFMERHNKKRTVIFNTVQLYRTDRIAYMEQLHKKARQEGFQIGFKLVRGAYMEKERARAERLNYDSPICANKVATDANFNAGLRFCMKHLDHFELFIGTHNETSTNLAVQIMKDEGISPENIKIWFGQLYGMSDNISFNLAQQGFNTAKYLPFGPLRDVIPYLLRRAEENTSVGSQTSRELFLIKKELTRRKRLKAG